MKPGTGIFFGLVAVLIASISAKSSLDRNLFLRRDQDSGKDFDVRLVGGQSENEGRVEVLHDGQWGTVCDDRFNYKEATVVCNSLGYYAGIEKSYTFGPGSGLIWLDEMECNGDEETLADCPNLEWGTHDCRHTEDVGVICYTEEQDFEEGDMRIADGNVESEGRVEIFHAGVWGTVCDDWFDDSAATVVCNSQGYNGGRAMSPYMSFGEGLGEIWLDDLQCRGDEETLADCPNADWGNHDCTHSEDAGVICNTDEVEQANIELHVGNMTMPLGL